MKFLKKIFYLLLITVILISILVFFSPYGYKKGFNSKVIEESIIINKTPEEVYNYLGNSDNAKDWSVYVDHISSLNPETHKDGEIGSKRRCFKNPDEKGAQWDEEILINEKNVRRRLNIYNPSGFMFMAENLITEQLYEEIDGKCKLSFTLFVKEGKNNFIDDLKIYLTAYFIVPIFEKNIKQVKKILEERP